MKQILLLESDAYIRSFGAQCLRRNGYAVMEIESLEAMEKLLQESPALDGAVVDAQFSEICGSLRLQYPELAILSLADEAQQADAVTGLMIGADAQLSKPFSWACLRTKMEQMLNMQRQEQIQPETLLSSGPFILNTGAYTLEKMDKRIELTRPEYDMLKQFLENPGKPLSTEEIYIYVWGREEDPLLQRVADTIRRLRLKIEDDPKTPVFITTLWGYGYQWR